MALIFAVTLEKGQQSMSAPAYTQGTPMYFNFSVALRHIREATRHSNTDTQTFQRKQDFPGDLVVRMLGFHCSGPGFNPDQGKSHKQLGAANK